MKSSYKPELDGLRAISILLVIISHAGFGNLIPGGLGVTVFFFVSGYLITSLLIDERETKGHIDLYKFYLRRFWRLLPPMFFFLMLSIMLVLLVNKHVKITDILAAIFYMANYYKIFFHFENLNGIVTSPFNILWSLAIEEHFYIIFAPLLALTYKSNQYFKVILAFLVIPLLVRLLSIYLFPYLLKDGGYNYSATEARIDSIAFGCLLACIFAGQKYQHWKSLLLNKNLLMFSVLLLIATLLFRNLYFRETFRYSLQNISLLVIVANIVYGSSPFLLRIKKFLSARYMILVGKLSYSLYLQHWFALVVVTLIIGPVGQYASWQASYWTLTILFTFFSYYLVEKPTIRFRKKYGSNV